MISAVTSSSSLRSMSRRVLTADQFDIVEELGTGSFGSVYRATDKITSQVVAIKKVDMENSSDDIDEIQKEISILAGCNDPHITRYYGSFVHGYKLWIIMEYLGGGSCLDLIKATGTLSEATIAYIAVEILQGLQYLHANGKIHRDIKAANLLVSDTGEVKIADFGVAAQLSSNLSRRNTFVGTPFWMAPEVIGQQDYTYSADIWSLGITCMELANGEPPLAHLHPMRVIFFIPKSPAPRLDERFSEDFRDFVSQCLQKHPHDRPNVRTLLKHSFLKRASKNDLVRRIHQLQAMAIPKHVSADHTIDERSLMPSEDDDDDWDFDTVKASTVNIPDVLGNATEEISSLHLDSPVSLQPDNIPSAIPSPEPEDLQTPDVETPQYPQGTVSFDSGYPTINTLRDTVSDRRSHLVRIFGHASYKFQDQTLAEIADILTTEPLTLQAENYLIKKIGKVAMEQHDLKGAQDKPKKLDAVESILLTKWLDETRRRQ